MILRITVYKPTGKYYSSHDVSVDDIEMSSSGFIKVIRDNLPGTYHDGYVTVADAADNQGFHKALFTWSYLFPECYCGDAYNEMSDKRRNGKISEQEFQAWYKAYCSRCQYMQGTCVHTTITEGELYL